MSLFSSESTLTSSVLPTILYYKHISNTILYIQTILQTILKTILKTIPPILFLQTYIYTYMNIYWFYFTVRSMWHLKESFQRNFYWIAWPEHLALPVWKRVLFHCTHSVGHMCRMKIVTHVYMKLRVPDDLVLFLYHSGIYTHKWILTHLFA